MVLARVSYQEINAKERLYAAFCLLQETLQGQIPIFVFIGTDKDLLDCLGPMTGSMLLEHCPQAQVFGSLDKPVTARNIGAVATRLRMQYPDIPVLAVDASISKIEEAGTVLLKTGSVLPGKALNKRLPAVGDYSLTAIVEHQGPLKTNTKSIVQVYHMARLISDGLAMWVKGQD